MEIEKAIKTAIDYETKIRDLYQEATTKTSDSAGKHIFQALGKDEQNHVDYLLDRLAHWQETDRLEAGKLETTIPSKEIISREVKKLKAGMATEDRTDEKQMLSKALKVEVETSDFYRQMVAQMEGEGQEMFARFLEIEDEHIAIVQAELDYISRTGYWFDFKEFDMEEL
jgi:rubrerythrin